MVQTIKFSQFNTAVAGTASDITVGLRNNQNQQFNGAGGGGTGTGTGVSKTITQMGHGFTAGQFVYIANPTGIYTVTLANTAATAELIGLVIKVIDANNFTLLVEGYVDVSTFTAPIAAPFSAPLAPGGVYFLSDTVNGSMTLVEPLTLGYISLPVFWGETTTTGWLRQSRGAINGGIGLTTGSTPASNPTYTTVTQVGAWAVGQVVSMLSPSTYQLAIATSLQAASAVGIIVQIITPGSVFVVQSVGYQSGLLTGQTGGQIYWVSAVTPGLMDTVAPTIAGQYLRQVYIAETATSGYIQDTQPTVIPAIPVPGSGWTLISSTAATGLINVSIPNMTGYYRYLIIVDGAIPVGPDDTNTRLLMRTSSNNGVSYDSGVADYQIYQPSGTAPTRAYMELTPTGVAGAPSVSSLVAYGGVSGEITVINSANINSRKQFLIKLGYTDVGAFERAADIFSGARLSSAIINAVQFFWYPVIGVRTFSAGTFKLYGTNV